MTTSADREQSDDEAPPHEPGVGGGLALIASYARPHASMIAVGVVLGLFATGITLATPMVAKWVLDSLGTSLDLAGPVGILLTLLVIGTIAGFAQTVLLGRLADHIVLDTITLPVSSRIQKSTLFSLRSISSLPRCTLVLLRPSESVLVTFSSYSR